MQHQITSSSGCPVPHPRVSLSSFIFLWDKAKAVETAEEIQSVATISANNESSIGALIADAMKRVGKDGVITIEVYILQKYSSLAKDCFFNEDGKSYDDELEVVEGMKFDRGFISPYFVTDQKRQVCEYENPYIMMYEKKVSNMQDLVPVLEMVLQQGQPLVIIAEVIINKILNSFTSSW